MNKPLAVIYAAVDTYSGYGANGRDKAKAIIELKKDEWDIKIISCRWGDTRNGFIDGNIQEWGFLKEYIMNGPLQKQPDYFFWITIPNEAQPMGKYNILITAGIETTVCHQDWILGCNRMNEIWVSSEHSKKVFETTQYEQRNQQGQVTGILKLEKPCKVVFEGANLNVYKTDLPKEVKGGGLYDSISNIKESYAYLFLGHWIGTGDLFVDRKNLGITIKAFFETFKNKQNKPALILKTCGAVSSYMDRNDVLKKIEMIKKTVGSTDLPNIYLLHGDFEDKEINELYNHPKVKAMITLGNEGFNRPALEFSLARKPIIASNWSGHVDFLSKQLEPMISGEVKQIPPPAVNQFLIAQSNWFYPNFSEIGETLTDVFKNYDKYLPNARKQGDLNKEKFSFEAMKNLIKGQLDQFPKFAQQVELKLPKLNLPTKQITLPKLTKIGG